MIAPPVRVTESRMTIGRPDPAEQVRDGAGRRRRAEAGRRVGGGSGRGHRPASGPRPPGSRPAAAHPARTPPRTRSRRRSAPTAAATAASAARPPARTRRSPAPSRAGGTSSATVALPVTVSTAKPDPAQRRQGQHRRQRVGQAVAQGRQAEQGQPGVITAPSRTGPAPTAPAVCAATVVSSSTALTRPAPTSSAPPRTTHSGATAISAAYPENPVKVTASRAGMPGLRPITRVRHRCHGPSLLHDRVAGRDQRVHHLGAVGRAAGLQLQLDLDVAQRQALEDPRVGHVEHVGAQRADQREQLGQRPGAVPHPHPQRQVAGRGGHAVLDDVQQHQRVDVAAGQHRDGRGREPVRAAPAARPRSTAPAGSTSILARSRQCSRARAMLSSPTVTMSSTSAATCANVTSPGRPTAIPSAHGAHARPARSATPAASDGGQHAASAACTPITCDVRADGP